MGYLKPKKVKAKLKNAINYYEKLMSVIPATQRSGYTKPGSQSTT